MNAAIKVWELFYSGLSLQWSVRQAPDLEYRGDDAYFKVIEYSAYEAVKHAVDDAVATLERAVKERDEQTKLKVEAIGKYGLTLQENDRIRAALKDAYANEWERSGSTLGLDKYVEEQMAKLSR